MKIVWYECDLCHGRTEYPRDLDMVSINVGSKLELSVEQVCGECCEILASSSRAMLEACRTRGRVEA